MPPGGEGAEDTPLQLLQFVGAQKAWELVYGAFDRGDDVPRKQFRQIVEQSGEEVVDPDDIEMLEDLIVAATNEALRQLEEDSAKSMEALTGGLNLGGGFPF